MTDQKRPLETAADLLVYAPLGFVLEARRMLPTFAERGRNQIAMTKMVGRFAVSQGRSEADRGIAKVTGRAESLLQEFGLRPLPDEEPEPQPEPVDTSAPAPRSGRDAADLPIPDYDSLAASQVIPRLEGLTTDELEAVARYEAAHRGRKTILGKVERLRSD